MTKRTNWWIRVIRPKCCYGVVKIVQTFMRSRVCARDDGPKKNILPAHVPDTSAEKTDTRTDHMHAAAHRFVNSYRFVIRTTQIRNFAPVRYL